MYRTFTLVVTLLLTITFFTACNDESVLPQPVVQTPLVLDPTEDVQIAEWWTNGKQLLHLYADGRYALHGSTNRYESAVERGRWSKGSYAVLWLEPYTTQHERIRVGIGKVENMLVLNVPKFGVMKPVDQPPIVLEDRVIGVWMSDRGTLQLSQDLHFDFTQRTRSASAGATATGEPNSNFPTQGTWRVIGRELELQPLSPAQQTIMLKVSTTGEGVSLIALDSTFRRASSRMTTEPTAQPE